MQGWELEQGGGRGDGAEAGRCVESLSKTFVQTGPPGEWYRYVVARKHVTLFLARLPSSLLQVVRDARAEICNLQCEFQHKFICGPNWHLRKTVKCFSILAILSRNLFRENQSFKNRDSPEASGRPVLATVPHVTCDQGRESKELFFTPQGRGCPLGSSAQTQLWECFTWGGGGGLESV